jgi:hypothetical protein
MKTYKREVLLEELNMHKPKLMSACKQRTSFPPFDSPASLAKIGGPVRGRAWTRPTVASEIQAILHLRLSNLKDFWSCVRADSRVCWLFCACASVSCTAILAFSCVRAPTRRNADSRQRVLHDPTTGNPMLSKGFWSGASKCKRFCIWDRWMQKILDQGSRM